VTSRFHLECTDCEFETAVTGEFAEVVTAVEEHRSAVEAGPSEHFVNVHRDERSVRDVE